MPRTTFDTLPARARQAVAERTGPIRSARNAGGGQNSAIATLLATPSGRLFLKGIPTDHPQAVAQTREAAINPHLPPSCPRLRWHLETDGWTLLAYDAITGRHADYRPGSPDLPLVLAALLELQAITAPDDVRLKKAEQRWAAYTPPGTAQHLVGTTLLHTDFAPDNILIDAHDRAHIIDWAWPTAGAAFIDPYVLALRLVHADHTAEEALNWARQAPSWATADPAAVTAFATATTRLWRDTAEADPGTWKAEMADAAERLEAALE